MTADYQVVIAVVKKTFRYSNVFLLQPLIPAFRISELISEKRYNSKSVYRMLIAKLEHLFREQKYIVEGDLGLLMQLGQLSGQE